MKKLSIILVLALVLLALFYPVGGASQEDSLRLCSRAEVFQFIVDTPVDAHEYHPILYNCLNFATNLWHQAYTKGMRASIVIANVSFGWAHAAVLFRTVEGEEYWVDGETKWIIKAPAEAGIDIPDYRGMSLITILDEGDSFRLWQGRDIRLFLSIQKAVIMHKLGT